MIDRTIRALGDVRRVLDSKRKLISLSTLGSNGYKYTSECEVLKVNKGDCIVMKVQGRSNYISYRVL